MPSLPIIYPPKGSIVLTNNDQWENRFEIRSESSNRVYIVAQNKKKRHFACSCPGWKRFRHCKHLMQMGLPGYEKPIEISVENPTG